MKDTPFTIYDEITTGLDPKIADQIEADIFARVNGFIFITHRYNPTIFQQADQIIVIEDGHIAAQGKLAAPLVHTALIKLHLN